MTGKYDDIINLPHHESNYRKRMPMRNRAAQFAPFAALSGHEEAISETARLTEEMIDLSEYEKEEINANLSFALNNNATVRIFYFEEDAKKRGGGYFKKEGRIKKWEELDRTLILEGEIKIPIEFVVKAELI